MKFTTTLTLLGLATASQAAVLLVRAESTASSETSYCNTAGQPCARVSGAATAFSAAMAAVDAAAAGQQPAHQAPASNAPGGAAFVAKRAADQLALALAASAGPPAAARAYYTGLHLDTRFPPDTPAAASLAPIDPAADVRACLVPAAPCDRAVRGALAVLAAVGDDPAARRDKRDPDPWCHFRGGFCKRHPEPWCHFRGGFCRRDGGLAEAEGEGEPAGVEAQCYEPDGLCTAKGRDLLAIQTAAHYIIAQFVEHDGQDK